MCRLICSVNSSNKLIFTMILNKTVPNWFVNGLLIPWKTIYSCVHLKYPLDMWSLPKREDIRTVSIRVRYMDLDGILTSHIERVALNTLKFKFHEKVKLI